MGKPAALISLFLAAAFASAAQEPAGAPVQAQPPALDSASAQDSSASKAETAAPSHNAGQPTPETAPAISQDGPAASQGEPGDEGDLTIEVDKNISRNRGKSLPLALLLSATLPGAGEYYLQEKGRAKTFFLVETGFWASLYVALLSKGSYLQSARNHASEFAGIDASRKSEGFLETMAKFRSYQEKQHRQDSYELAQILGGKREQDYGIAPIPENYWDFGSSNTPANTKNWNTFQSTMRYYRASKVAVSFAIGALVLNRLASLANTLNVHKRTTAQGVGLYLLPELGPAYAGTTLMLRF